MKYPLLQSSEKVRKACCVFSEEIGSVRPVLAIQVEGANFAWKNNKSVASGIRSIIIHPEKSSMTAIRHQTYNCEYGKAIIEKAPSTVSSVPGSPSGHRLDDEDLRDFRPLPRQ